MRYLRHIADFGIDRGGLDIAHRGMSRDRGDHQLRDDGGGEHRLAGLKAFDGEMEAFLETFVAAAVDVDRRRARRSGLRNWSAVRWVPQRLQEALAPRPPARVRTARKAVRSSRRESSIASPRGVATVTVGAVVDIVADARVFGIGLRLQVATGTGEHRIIVGIRVAGSADAVGIAMRHGEPGVVKGGPGPIDDRRQMAGETGLGETAAM